MRLAGPPSAAGPRPAAEPRDGIVVILRLSVVDAEVRRLEQALKLALTRIERRRVALMKLRARIGWESDTLERRGEAASLRGVLRRRLSEHEATCAAAGASLQRGEAEALTFSAELQRKRIEADELRIEVGRRISSVLLGQYEAALLAGRLPAVVGLRDGRCGGCRRRLPPALAAEVRDGNGLTPCPRCRRLLYDASWLERDFKPATLRVVTKRGP